MTAPDNVVLPISFSLSQGVSAIFPAQICQRSVALVILLGWLTCPASSNDLGYCAD